jgi:ribosomal protein S18
MFSLDRILSERDPMRVRFLDKSSNFNYGPAAATHSGLNIGYCIFCAHGHSHDAPGGLPLMREDNTLLLNRFVSPDGRILPRRFTGVCSKHQRHLARTVKRSRALNLMPFQQKLNSQLRFTRMEPDPVTEPAAAARGVSILGKLRLKKEPKKAEGAAELDAALDELQSMLDADANAGLSPVEPVGPGADARA